MRKNSASGRRNRIFAGKGHGRILGGDENELGVTLGGGPQAYLLIAHLPVGLVSKAQHLPHHNPKAPHIAGRGEGAMGNGFWGCPTDGDLSSLTGHVGQKGDVFQGMVGGGGEKTPVQRDE